MAQIALAAVALLAVIAVVPPFRRAAALGLSKVVLAAASPWAPSIGNFDDLPTASRIVAADGTELARLDGAQRREPVSIKQLPPHVPQAVLAAEDGNFYHHGGVDPQAVLRAVVRSAEGRTQGGSTITQQLAKINYTNSQRTILRKLRELQYAVRLEKKYTKDQLLERYLNQVYFGDGAYGIAAAAKTFFGVEPEQLTPAQAAMLAGKIRSPEGLDPRTKPEAMIARRNSVLANMRRHHWLTPDQAAQAEAEPMALAANPTDAAAAAARAPHFVEYVKREAATIDALGGSAESRGHQLFTGGYTVETTLEPALYDEAADAVRSTLSGPADPATAMVTVQPGDGAIRMLFGGLTFDRKFDVASQGRRQPGSSFKPYVYLAAIRHGISPRTTFDSSSPKTLPYKGGSFTVNNYEGEGSGPSDIDNAMTHSINVVFSQLALATGLDNVVRTAESAGIPEEVLAKDGDNPAMALGGLTKGLTPLEQAAAYATFAAKGVYASPYSITRIKDRTGRVVYTHSPKTRQAFDPNEVGVLNNALMQVVKAGTGRAADIGRPVAGKTGTTQNYGDAWFVGFVPQLATAVWVGYPDKIVPMTSVHGVKVAGGTFPARMWAAYMVRAVESLPVKQIDTATPESLSLHVLNEAPPTLPPPSTTPLDSTTSSSSTTSSTVTGFGGGAGGSTTTSSSPGGSTTTTAKPATTTTSTTQKKQTTTSTTAPATTTTAKPTTNTTAGDSRHPGPP
ncbi:MAG: penicillin-binding protein [Acidimicrobiaceae bacterium]|nr:penicillin-binding protein [Acidimicrobiaceae bacterium]